jgi:hypothetical protein
MRGNQEDKLEWKDEWKAGKRGRMRDDRKAERRKDEGESQAGRKRY